MTAIVTKLKQKQKLREVLEEEDLLEEPPKFSGRKIGGAKNFLPNPHPQENPEPPDRRDAMDSLTRGQHISILESSSESSSKSNSPMV